MSIHIRNLRMGQVGWAGSLYWARGSVVLRELFLAGRWTDGTFGNKTEFDNNIVETKTDFQVDPAYPNQIRMASAPSGSYNYQYMITLLASNDQNRGVYRVITFYASGIAIIENPPPNGWITETGISGRIFQSGEGDNIANYNYARMVAPTGSLEARFGPAANGYTLHTYAYPDGTNLTTYLPVEAFSAATPEGFLSAYFNGNDALFFGAPKDQNSYWMDVFGYGELEGVASGDTYPGYNMVVQLPKDDPFAFEVIATKINTIDSNTPTTKYTERFLVQTRGIQWAQNYLMAQKITTRANTRIKLDKPWTFCSDATAGFPRGKVGSIRLTNQNWEPLRPINDDWFHFAQGLCVPRSGPNDLRLTILE